MIFFSRRRYSSLLAPYLFGVGCMAIGAGIAFLVAPTSGARLRNRIASLFRRQVEEVEGALDRMTSERGIGQHTHTSTRARDTHV